MIYKFLLFDLDDTIFDFQEAENTALTAMFASLKIELTSNLRQQYHLYNQSLWEQYERGQITKAELFQVRFDTFFKKMNLPDPGINLDKLYRGKLADQHQLLPRAEPLLAQLAKNYRLYAVTNGITNTQLKRMAEARIDRYFDNVFISEQIGHQKPKKLFFDYVFAHIPNFQRQQALIIGDSLSADILGGVNAGVDTLWFNPNFLPNRTKILPTYQIADLMNLDKLLLEQR